ncbi:helical backbone metal receptor [Puia dinghuensis]|uniref:Iron ABC transporter n=1 Tax=Puia dinghuensis TaxID=1792502 RepID=A0A8J2UBC6_9BACT|nr:helical backbone metal receptor [Puia dinghuensis]GGA91630.1 iron ABC transporter [Puia dinghuensis]
MPSFTDQLGRTLFLPQTPRRIISLVPSQTELLYTLGLDAAVVGITKFCVHPESWFRTKPRVGGTKAIDPARVDALKPDLIIANKEENEKPQIEALAARYPVWVSDVKNLSDALAMIRSLGQLTGATTMATALASTIATRFNQLPIPTQPIPAAYFIWRNPWMVAGGDTFINDMLHYCGFTNIFAGHDRYPTVDLSSLAGPVHILLSSEPYPFRERHIDEIKEVLPEAAVRLVDGEFFSWYGSRLLDAPAYFSDL